MGSTREGFHTITPYLAVSDGNRAIALYEKALDAKTIHKMTMPGSDKIMHACLQIGTSKLFLADACDMMPAPKGEGSGAHFYLYVDDVDRQHRQAVAAGMREKSAPEDMFWGDRTSVLTCPYGSTWTLAMHIRDVSDKEMAEAMKQMAE